MTQPRVITDVCPSLLSEGVHNIELGNDGRYHCLNCLRSVADLKDILGTFACHGGTDAERGRCNSPYCGHCRGFN
jgi:hypothetical protein